MGVISCNSPFDKPFKSVLHIADFIGKLIEKNKLIEAVRSLCALKLNDKFPTVPLLKAYVEDAKKWSEVICSLKISLAEKVSQLFFGFLILLFLNGLNFRTILSVNMRVSRLTFSHRIRL